MLGDAGRRDQVERARTEPVRGAGEGTYGANLHRVAGVIAREWLARLVFRREARGRVAVVIQDVRVERANLRARAALLQVNEWVAGDFIAESRAPLAKDAALAVEQHLSAERERLLEDTLDVHEPGVAVPVAHGLVLQRALAPLVAHGAVERVVDEQQLHHALLRAVCLL